MTGWRKLFAKIPKGSSMPQDREHWEARAAMDQELILEQREEINKLKCKVNQLEQRRHGNTKNSMDGRY